MQSGRSLELAPVAAAVPVVVRPRRARVGSTRCVPSRTEGGTNAAVALVALAVAVLGGGAYAGVRALALSRPGRATANGEFLLTLERALHLDVERGVQEVVARWGPVQSALDVVYALGYWPILAGAALVLATRDRRTLARFAVALLLSGAVGLLVVAAVPVAPPRLLDGFVDTVERSRMLARIARPGGITNPYAALPSFHVGWVALAGVATVHVTRRRLLRAACWLPLALMAVAVVATANHYVVDGIAGVGLVLVAWVVAGRVVAVAEAQLIPGGLAGGAVVYNFRSEPGHQPHDRRARSPYGAPGRDPARLGAAARLSAAVPPAERAPPL